jgi:hypothetical protein
MSIAPIITAVELTFNPMDATTIAQAKIHKLEPLKEYYFTKSILFFSSSPYLG